MILDARVRSHIDTWFNRARPERRARSAGFASVARRSPNWRQIALAGLCLAVSVPAFATPTGGYQLAGDLAVYLGIVPAQIVRGHPEAQMHSGAPHGSGEYHIVVALFEATSGARVTNAEVGANVSGMGHIAETRIALEPMLTEGVVTYGGFVSLAGRDRYTITIEIRRPGAAAAKRIMFVFDVDADLHQLRIAGLLRSAPHPRLRRLSPCPREAQRTGKPKPAPEPVAL